MRSSGSFKKGQSGNPGGRPKEKQFTEALRLAVHRVCEHDKEGRKNLTVLGEKLVQFAMEGEGWAFQMIADRLDGKLAQESTVTIDDKREATDWSREELVSFLNDARESRQGTTEAVGRSGKSDRIH